MSLWQGLTSAASWLGDKAGDIGEGISDFFTGDDDGDMDLNTKEIVKKPNQTSLLHDANGELNDKDLVDGFSEEDEFSESEEIETLESDQKDSIELDTDGSVAKPKILHPYSQDPNFNKNAIQGDIDGEGSLLDVALEPGASGGLYSEEFTGPWSPEVYDQKKRDAGFDETGHQDKGVVKGNVNKKEEEILNAKLEEEKRKAEMKGKMKDFGSKVSQIGNDMMKNPYEYKPW